MEQLQQLEGFNVDDWTYEQVIYHEEDEGVEFWAYLHKDHRSDNGGVELEITPEAGWCVFVRWGTSGDERAFLTVEEAVDFWQNHRGE